MVNQVLGRIVTASKSVTRLPYDCIDLLRSDHMKIEALLVQHRLVKKPERRRELFRQIRNALLNHMELEENIFYPAAEKIPQIRKTVQHGRKDHQLVRVALNSLEVSKPDSRRYDQLATKLIVELERHVMAEENKVLPAVRRHLSRAEFARLNTQVLEQYKELQNSRPPAARKAA